MACFAAGTCLATPAGERAVETLRAGDTVLTARGSTEHVVWVGHRTLIPSRHPRPWDVNPVHIAPGAFGQGMPARELVLSPDHAVFLGGALIPVRYLLNGATVTQRSADRVTFHHVELARHDVLLVEGLPCESFLDTGNRASFVGGKALALHPDFARNRWARDACAPLVLDGPALAVARQALLARAAALGWRQTANPSLQLCVAGRLVAPARVAGRLVFALRRGASDLRLVSRSAVPAQIRADDPDHRRLGVAVAEIVAPGAAIGFAGGWLPPEGGWRWTDRDTALHLQGDADRLLLRLVPLLRYWVPPASARRAAA